jgi:surfactin synthase thioesterase subunit
MSVTTHTIQVEEQTSKDLMKLFGVVLKNDLNIRNNYNDRIKFAVSIAARFYESSTDEQFKQITGLDK